MASKPRAASVSSSSSEPAVTRKPRSAVCSNSSNMDLHHRSADDFTFQNPLDILLNFIQSNRCRQFLKSFESPFTAELPPDFQATIVRQQCGADAGEHDAAENERMDGQVK